ncbi:hypothetical protein ACFXTH_028399 [Malus domestica]
MTHVLHSVSGWERFDLYFDTKDRIMVCYNRTINPSGGIWRVLPSDSFLSPLGVLIIKLSIAVFNTRILTFAFKPLHQPSIISQIIAGMTTSTRALGQLTKPIFPFSTLKITETMGNLALVYYMFLVGLELDFKPVVRAGKKALSIALTGFFFSVLLGWVLCRYLLLQDFVAQTHDGDQERPTINGPLFWGVALATTNFPDLARILADLKLLYSDVGGLALSASVITDLCSWILLLLVMAIINSVQMYAVGLTSVFLGLCVFVVRPALSWIVHRVREREKEERNNSQLIRFVLAGVLLSGVITDACGSHSIVGPFVLGAIMPKGEFTDMLKQKVGNFVPSILMPLYFCINGGRVNFEDILGDRKNPIEQKTGATVGRVVWVTIIAFATKTVSTFVAGIINKMSPRDSLALGVLMNTKGLLTLIILNSGRDIKALNKQTFGVLMVVIWVMTFAVGPFIAYFYKSSAKTFVQYKQRSLASVGPNNQFRVLVCVHTSRNVPGIINLLEASNPTTQSPLHVLAVHLVELTGHASAMLVVHDACKTKDVNFPDKSSSPTNAIELYAKQRQSVTVQSLTAVSAYPTMHEDICNLAEDNRVSIIIIPYHKKATILDGEGGARDEDKSHLKNLNNNLMENARCSVGVLLDRGIGTSNYFDCCRHFTMLFFGGTDDREALAYAGRMAGHPRVTLTVITFNIMSKEAAKTCVDDDDDGDEYNDEDEDDNENDNDDDDVTLEGMKSTGEEKKMDDLYLDEFRLRSMNDASIKFVENWVTSWEQILSLIQSTEGEYDMFIVGRRHGEMQEVATTLLDDDDSNDIGVLGEALVSSIFTASTSILIVQKSEFAHDS